MGSVAIYCNVEKHIHTEISILLGLSDCNSFRSLGERYTVDLGLGLGLLCNLNLLTTVHDGEYRYSISNKGGKKGSEFH